MIPESRVIGKLEYFYAMDAYHAKEGAASTYRPPLAIRALYYNLPIF